MPSFDIVSEVDLTEVKNATNQFRKEIAGRFDFRGVVWDLQEEKEQLTLTANDDYKVKEMAAVLLDKMARRGISLKNIDEGELETSSAGRGRQVLKLKQGLEVTVSKQIVAELKASGLKVQATIEGPKVRVAGKKRDDLQAAIAHLRAKDFPAALQFNNFRE